MKVIHYPRVSSKKQADKGDSIESQEKKLENHSKINEDEVVGVYTDAGKSASISDDKLNISYSEGKFRVIIDISKRQGMVKILDEINSDKFEGVKFTKWDRFSRNSLFSRIVQIYFSRFNKSLIPIEDSNDPLLKEIKGAMGEEEIRRMKGRVRDSRLVRFDNGMMVGRSPFGYEPIIKNKKVVGFRLKKKESEIVKDVFEMSLEGIHYTEICHKHNLRPQQISNILKNKVYYGIITFEGKEKVGNHPSIITEETFRKVNKL